MKISKARIAVVIGTGGQTKNQIENTLGVKINLDSKSGDCEILPNPQHSNYSPLNVYTAQKIVTAINRGFNPQKAMKLTDEGYDLEIFNLISIIGKSSKRLKHIKGRIIGRKGEMRKAIERFASSYVSVHGKTIAVIADYENLQIARKAISMLISGTPHHVVLKFLESKYNQKKKEEFRQFYKPEF
jgi:ribosomal RNA assembly protein